MADERIWAPWRLPYVKDASKDTDAGCIFCTKPAEDDDAENLILHRGERAFVIMNLFPYTNGHLMVAPFEHRSRIQDLDEATLGEVMALGQRSMNALDRGYSPDGFNVGFNQGRVAGAGFEGHIHMHVVPRWGGDTNFMPVLADTRVLSQSLEQGYELLREVF
jgi:ATP adenylyltransferase